jgi:hypothetical protein
MRRRALRSVLFVTGFALAMALTGGVADAQAPLCDAARDECARGGDCTAYMCYCFGGPFCVPLG